MFFLTKQEKTFIVVSLVLLLAGGLMDFVLKQSQGMSGIVNFLNSERLSPQIDLNTASEEELKSIPSVGPSTARRIADYRSRCNGFQRVEELRNVKGIGGRRYEQMAPFVKVEGKT